MKMVLGIDHIELIVSDLEKFISLFEKMGFEVILRTPHHGGSAELKLPGEGQPVFELHSVEDEENPGINHIALACDDIEKTHRSMVDQGVVFEKGPYLVPASGRTIATFRDPGGWRLQLVDSRRVEPKEDPSGGGKDTFRKLKKES
jgi:glyoxylase I family protein